MQKSKLWLQIALATLPSLMLALPNAYAQKASKPAVKQQGQFADGIAAIVDTSVITQREVNERIAALRVSGQTVSAEQALSMLIDERVMNTYADQVGIRIPNAQVQQVLMDIAQENHMSLEDLHTMARQNGVNWDNYVETIRNQLKMEELRNSIVHSNVNVTERDVDAFLIKNPTGLYPEHKTQVQQPRYEQREVIERSFDPKAVAFQHIFIRVPDGASDEVVAAARQRANEALAKIRKGQSFASVAKEYSDAAEGKNGGDLGIRLNEDWPDLFMKVTRKVRDGGVTNVFQAANGFHILKVVERRGIINEQRKVVNVRLPDPPPSPLSIREKAAKQAGPVNVTESHVRHILVRITPVFSDAQAKAKIDEIAQHLQSGESFADVASKYSQDASASLGGDIGWIAPGQADPSFQAAVDQLPEGQVSMPVRSQFGWHIIEVLERRTEDKQPAIRRELARDTLYQEQAANVLQDWADKIRSQSYIENRLTGEKTVR
ncbi:peptidylprolyl isomerase [Pelistega sp. NLN82]|uniref:Chaperone SurA n=1 Tax=Pelistega ratti TaxID=2652177 RepID=A0A6L9Y6Z4_9BURK|nr:peptidylprolyl isomerase [Pelistega ratti]NEN76096.1 peptidylprolyl isomerase [Pelistega ratti]